MSLSLEFILRQLADRGELEHVTLFRTTGGRYQGARNRPGTFAYKVAVCDDPADALREALAPDHGHSWIEHLGMENELL